MSKLLIVEDDGNICQLLELLLKDNHKLTIVNTGTEALLQVNQAQFDLILLDLMLPGVTGESVLTTIRKTSQHLLSSRQRLMIRRKSLNC